MNQEGTPYRYISGPHSSDYYLLLDEQSDHIFAARLAGYAHAAGGPAAASLLEMWIDEADKNVWYVFQVGAVMA